MATEHLTRLLDEAEVPYELLPHERTESALAEAEALGIAHTLDAQCPFRTPTGAGSPPERTGIAEPRPKAEGDALLAPPVTRQLIAEFARRPTPRAGRRPSSPPGSRRGLDVLKAPRARALECRVAASSRERGDVKTHAGNLLMKLGLHDRFQAVVLSHESGLVQPGATAASSQRAAVRQSGTRHVTAPRFGFTETTNAPPPTISWSLYTRELTPDAGCCSRYWPAGAHTGARTGRLLPTCAPSRGRA